MKNLLEWSTACPIAKRVSEARSGDELLGRLLEDVADELPEKFASSPSLTLGWLSKTCETAVRTLRQGTREYMAPAQLATALLSNPDTKTQFMRLWLAKAVADTKDNLQRVAFTTNSKNQPIKRSAGLV